jgi:hypothetical protein
MVRQKPIDIHLHLPATDYPSAGKHVILETAVPKIDLTAHPRASNRFVIVLFKQSVHLFC